MKGKTEVSLSYNSGIKNTMTVRTAGPAQISDSLFPKCKAGFTTPQWSVY